MAVNNSTATEIKLVPHPYFLNKSVSLPSKGKLKWLGGSLGLAGPVHEDVIDDEGNHLTMDLSSLLNRLNEFEGFRDREKRIPIQDNLISNCIAAHKYNLLTPDELLIFERSPIFAEYLLAISSNEMGGVR